MRIDIPADGFKLYILNLDFGILQSQDLRDLFFDLSERERRVIDKSDLRIRGIESKGVRSKKLFELLSRKCEREIFSKSSDEKFRSFGKQMGGVNLIA